MILNFRTDKLGQTVKNKTRLLLYSLIRVFIVCHFICIIWRYRPTSMLNLLVSKTPTVWKRLPILNISYYVLLNFDLVCVNLAYYESLAITKWLLFPLRSFPLVLPPLASKSKLCPENNLWKEGKNKRRPFFGKIL